MCETAVPATYREMPATYYNIMGAGHMAVPAFGCFKKVPDIVTAYSGESSGLSDIFNTGDKDTGRTAVFTRYLRLVRYSFYNLVRYFPAMIAVSAEFCKNKPIAHGKYWISGFINLLHISSKPKKCRLSFIKLCCVTICDSNHEKLFPYHDKSQNIRSISGILKIAIFFECVE
jgi:hypothetical protein